MGAANVAGSPGVVTIGEKSYRMTPLGPGEFGELERHIVGLRINPIGTIAGQLGHFSLEERKQVIKAAVELSSQQTDSPTIEELGAYSHTWDGFCFVFHLMVRQHHPEIDSQEKAKKVLQDIDDAGIAMLEQWFLQLEAADSLGKNSEGPVQITEMETDPHESRGRESMSS